MGLILHSFLLEASLLLLTLLSYWYLRLHRKYKELQGKGIPATHPILIMLGTLFYLWKPTHVSIAYGQGYKQLAEHKIYALTLEPTVLLIRDPNLVNSILIRDFSSFHDRGVKVDTETNPLEGHLFMLNGELWRAVRNKLSPTFTSGKLKGMYPLMLDCVELLMKGLEKRLSDGEVEVVDLLECFTTDVIGSCAFSYAPTTFEEPNSEFRRMGRRALRLSSWDQFVNLFRFLFPGLFFRLKVRTLPKEVNDFFFSVVRQTFEERLRTGAKREDFLQLLLQLREKGHVDIDPREEGEDEESTSSSSAPTESIELTDELLTAQAFVFLLAGFETTAASMSYTLFELAKNPDCQERLRQEILETKRKHGSISYQALKEMTFLDACLSETLRIHSPVSIIMRESTKNYVTDDGTLIDKGTMVMIPVGALQADPEHFPDPERFDPERFAPGASIRPGTYFPFGDGPRNCIGKRFALLEAKLGLARILESYEVSPSEKTKEPIPVNSKSFILIPEFGIWLKLARIPQDEE